MGCRWAAGVGGRRVYNTHIHTYTHTYIHRYVYYIYLNAFRELNEFCGRWSCRSRRQLGRFTCACTCVRVCVCCAAAAVRAHARTTRSTDGRTDQHRNGGRAVIIIDRRERYSSNNNIMCGVYATAE